MQPKPVPRGYERVCLDARRALLAVQGTATGTLAARGRHRVRDDAGARRPDRLDARIGAAGPHGWEEVYTLNGELYRSKWFASEALARADLATKQDALAAAGWTPVPFQP